MMRPVPICFLVALASALPPVSFAQISVTATETLPLPSTHMWGYARFSPDGSKIYYTSHAYQGIWEFDRPSRRVRQITDEQGTGFGFALSHDGKSISYRRTVRGRTLLDKSQEVVVRSLASDRTEVVGKGRSLSTPAPVEGGFTYLSGRDLPKPPSKHRGFTLIGIVDTKIAAVVDGAQQLLDPLKDGSYIWPALSPDKSLLAAYDMDRGAFVYDLRSQQVTKLGKAEGLAWTKDGEWLLSFAEENDGYRITGSDLHAVRKDGSRRTNLTKTTGVVELFPSASPTEDAIVCHTLDGKLLLLRYSVKK